MQDTIPDNVRRLIKRAASRYGAASGLTEDLEQEGYLAAWLHTPRHEPTQGSLAAFLNRRITGAMQDYLRSNGHPLGIHWRSGKAMPIVQHYTHFTPKGEKVFDPPARQEPEIDEEVYKHRVEEARQIQARLRQERREEKAREKKRQEEEEEEMRVSVANLIELLLTRSEDYDLNTPNTSAIHGGCPPPGCAAIHGPHPHQKRGAAA